MSIVQSLIKGGEVPSAPTIGSAETLTQTSARVSFTAPVSGAPILDYTVTANPSGIQATGASSPIDVTGLTARQAVNFSVTARNAAGSGPASGFSNIVQPTNVTLGARSVARVGVDGGIIWDRNGAANLYQNGASAAAISGEWSNGTATTLGDYYEIQISSVSGTVSGNSNLTAGTWTLINTPRIFALTTAGSFVVSIRSAGAASSLASATITIT